MENYLDSEKIYDIKKDMNIRAGILIFLGLFCLVSSLLFQPKETRLQTGDPWGTEYVIYAKMIGSKLLWACIALLEVSLGLAAFFLVRRIFFIIIAIWSILHGIWVFAILIASAFNFSVFEMFNLATLAVGSLYFQNAYKSYGNFHDYRFFKKSSEAVSSNE